MHLLDAQPRESFPLHFLAVTGMRFDFWLLVPGSLSVHLVYLVSLAPHACICISQGVRLSDMAKAPFNCHCCWHTLRMRNLLSKSSGLSLIPLKRITSSTSCDSCH